MGLVSDDLFSLIEETLGCGLVGLQVESGKVISVKYGKQEDYAFCLEIQGESSKTSLYLDRQPEYTEREVDHLRKILNIFNNKAADTPSRVFCGAEILDTITNKKAIDEVLSQLLEVLVGRGGFDRAGIMFLNEALLELRGVIFADGHTGEEVPAFKNTKIVFNTKNQLSDIMFYDRTEVVAADSSSEMGFLKDYFCNDVLVTGLGVGDRPIGILMACKDDYSESDRAALLLYGNICSLSIEFSRTVKQLELTAADLHNLRKTAMNAENLVKMGRLSATVAHELKNPLVAIGGFTKRMEQTAVNPQTKNYIKIVQSEVHRLERIVGDILVYSRKIDLDIEEFDLRKLVDEALELSNSCLCFNMISVTLRFGDDFKVQADRDKIKQVLLNLISNSVQEMPEGGEIFVDTSESEKHVTLSVSDTGGGIPSDKRKKIFEPFYTLKKSGTGLGLPLCKKIMTAHGGDIFVGDSENGAVFTLILPKRG